MIKNIVHHAKHVYMGLFVALAIMVQIQVTLFSSETYYGLRVNLADVFLPVIGMGVLGSLMLKKTAWPEFKNPYIIWSLLALSGSFSIALYTGITVNAELNIWAFLNKYIGLYVLLSYFALGAWLVRNAYNTSVCLNRFVSVFCGFFVLTVCVSVLCYVVQIFIPVSLWITDYPLDGFMANRNAFMVLAVFVGIFIESMYAGNEKKSHKIIRSLFWLTLPVFFLFNASRAGWIIFTVILGILLIRRPKTCLRTICPFLLVGSVLSMLIFHVAGSRHTAKQFGFLINPVFKSERPLPETDRKRLIAVEDGLALYKNSNPVFGAGLGTYKPFQIEKRGEFIDIIDFTGLWMLVETGIAGLLSLVGFVILSIQSLYTRAQTSPFHRALLWAIVCTVGLSVLHELMYTRFIWLFLGMGLATSQNNPVKTV